MYSISDGTCSNSCPTGQYIDSTTNTCLDCNTVCKSCSDPIYCDSCDIGLFLFNGDCLLYCLDGYYSSD